MAMVDLDGVDVVEGEAALLDPTEKRWSIFRGVHKVKTTRGSIREWERGG